MADATMVVTSRQHSDRWSAFAAHPGIKQISRQLSPDQLRAFDIFQDFEDDFLIEISPDVTVATWIGGAVVFEAGSYLDIAFFIVNGEVDMILPRSHDSHRPIFMARGAVAAPTRAPISTPTANDEVAPRGKVVSLASADFDLAVGETLRLGPGELFGEIGAMNGWPQSVSARMVGECTLLQVRVPTLRKLRRKSRKLKLRLDEAYKSRALRGHLASTPLLAGCAADVIEALAARVELVSFQPGELVTREGDEIEHMLLVRCGSLRMSQALGTGEVAVSYVSKGASIGESELLVDENSAWEVTCTSVGHSELVRIPKRDFLAVLERAPELQRRLWEVATARIKEIAARRGNLARADLLDFTLAKGLTQANSVLVIDLDSCTRCDDCVRGCASTHEGTARFVREGEVYEGFMVARSCYHCQDPTCLVGCPTGAITRLNIGDVVAVDPVVCIGCGACAENCAYDAIVMHQLGTTWGPDAVPSHLRGESRAVAAKCDLCHSSPEGPACVSSCPHGAAYRVSGAEEFDLLLQLKRAGGALR